MHSFYKKFRLTFLSLILILSFNSIDAQQITDLIQPVNLTAGVTDSLLASDLFYSTNYNLSFSTNSSVKISFDKNSKILCLTPDKNFEGMTLINFKLGKKDYEIPAQVIMTQHCSFSYKPEEKVKQVNLFGTFNGWNRQSLPMKLGEDGTYRITIPLEAGRYEYKFFVDGKEIADPANPEKTPSGVGDFNSVVTVAPRHTGTNFLEIVGKKFLAESIKLKFYFDKEHQKGALKNSNVIALINNEKISSKEININGNEITVEIKKHDLKENPFVRIAVNQDGEATNIQTIRFISGKPAGEEKNVTLQDQIIYSIMIDRFFDGDSSNDKPVKVPDLSYKAN